MKSIWDSLRLFQNNAVMIIAITLPFIVLLEIFESIYIETYLRTPFATNDLLPLLVGYLVIKPFYSIAIVLYISSVIAQPYLSITQTWSQSLRYWPVYFVFSLISTFIIGAGALFYILPGLYFFICFSFAEFYLLLEKQSPLRAIKSSFKNTRKYLLLLALGFLVFGVFILYSHSVIYSIFNLTSPEISRQFLEAMIQQNPATNALDLNQETLLIKYPEYSVLKSFVNITFNVLAIIFTIFAFRVYRLSKEKEV